MSWLERNGSRINLTMTRAGGMNREVTLSQHIPPHAYSPGRRSLSCSQRALVYRPTPQWICGVRRWDRRGLCPDCFDTINHGPLIGGAQCGFVMVAKHRKTNSSWEMGDARRDQPRTCAVSGKRMYSNEREANATAAYRMTNKESGPSQLRTYKCLYCGACCLTSKEA
jgi:hypothetical protein